MGSRRLPSALRARINRYMLGCKSLSQSNALSVSIRINRHMLGCKCCIINCKKHLYSELIDTCWDVNVKDCAATTLVLDELIDTCWDVNSLEDAKSDCIK